MFTDFFKSRLRKSETGTVTPASAPTSSASTSLLPAPTPKSVAPTPRRRTSTPRSAAPTPAAGKRHLADTSRFVGGLTDPRHPLAKHSAELHARRLIEWVRADASDSPRQLLHEDIFEMYVSMCFELQWEIRHWNPVAAQLTKLTTGKKVYAWIERDGERRRLRIYPIPLHAAAKRHRTIADIRKEAA